MIGRKLDNGPTIIMQDAPVLDIDKTDIAGNLLPGATLTIRDANDEVVDTWATRLQNAPCSHLG